MTRFIEKPLTLLLLLISVGLILVVARQTGFPAPVEAIDERQGRLDRAAPAPSADQLLVQSFIARHNGLCAIDLLWVVWPPEEVGGQSGTITLRLVDDDGRSLGVATWATLNLTHNDPLRFNFSPVKDSAGRRFSLHIEGTEGNRITVWAFSLDGYERGELLFNDQRTGGDLSFTSFYRLTPASALSDAVRKIVDNLGLLLVFMSVLFIPGLSLFPRLEFAGRDPAVRLGLALALDLALLPLAWLWMSVVGGRWSGLLLWLVIGVTSAYILVKRSPGKKAKWFTREMIALGAILVLTLVTRIIAIRDLVMPVWVDSPQHWLISRMMADSGRVPSDYVPWMPVDTFWYHFGFHALAASLNQMTGLPLERIMLIGGQMLNALVPLSVYTGAVLLTRRRRTGLLAAFFTGLLSVFPAYYVAWGRYTQLTGMLLLPPLVGLVYRLVERGAFARRGRILFLAGIMLGGLFLIHARVWVYAVVWLGVITLVGAGWRSRSLIGEKMLLMCSTMFLVSLPWWWRVGERYLLPLLDQVDKRGDPGGYNAIPWEYLDTGWERLWLAIAGLGLIWAVGILLFRRSDRGRAFPIALLAAWVLALVAIVNANRVGIPTFGLVNNNTLFISFYFPVGVTIGWLIDEWTQLAKRYPVTQIICGVVVASALTWSGLFGLGQMASIVNQDTVLVSADDLAMIEWVGENLPEDAMVAVNGWIWLGQHWAGSDAGYWLMPLTGRASTVPPIGYTQNPDYRATVQEFNADLESIDRWDEQKVRDLFAKFEITHVFIGQRGGVMRPEKLKDSPFFNELESNGGAWVFTVGD